MAGFCLVTHYQVKTAVSHRAAGFRPTADLAASSVRTRQKLRMRDAQETIVFTVSTQMPACVIHIQDKINTLKICILWTPP